MASLVTPSSNETIADVVSLGLTRNLQDGKFEIDPIFAGEAYIASTSYQVLGKPLVVLVDTIEAFKGITPDSAQTTVLKSLYVGTSLWFTERTLGRKSSWLTNLVTALGGAYTSPYIKEQLDQRLPST